MFETYARLAARALSGEPPSDGEARWILDGEDVELLPLLQAAFAPRRKHFGRRVMIHVLNNVRSGLCPEDCGYCSQRRDSKAPIARYAMKSESEVLAEAEAAARGGATRYCMVLSGRGPTIPQTRELAGLIRKVRERYPVEVCLSVGILEEEHARILKEAGLDRLNHNLNTSEERYASICSTHSWSDRIRTLEAARKSGIETCSGLIIGMGESSADVVEVAFTLRDLETPSIPVNFLVPIEGNPVFSDGSLSPERCLRALCLMRFVNPTAEIRAAGGREGHLRSLNPLLLWPANSLFVEGYLTTRGDATQQTMQMIHDAGFEVEGNPGFKAEASLAPGAFQIPGAPEVLKPTVPEG